jgi:hypothetical protein
MYLKLNNIAKYFGKMDYAISYLVKTTGYDSYIIDSHVVLTLLFIR